MLIQWFPGHMAKTKRLIIEHLKMVDVAVELLDARIPVSSANPMVEQLIQGKNHLVILNKADLADPEVTEQWVSFYKGKGIRVIPVSSTSNKDRKKLLAAIKETAAPALEKWKRRGIRNRSARIMILGIPNVGKSTLINRLAGTAATRTANTPGHTRGKQWVRLAQGLDLLDTPGVLWPKFDDQQIGLKLALLGSIRDEVVTMDELAMFAVEWLMENNPSSLIETYGIEIQDTPWHTLELVAIKRGYLQKGQIDENRLMNSFVKDMRENKCGLITWEKPNVG